MIYNVIKLLSYVIRRPYDVKKCIKMSQMFQIQKEYEIYYVIKPLYDLILRPYDVKKCIKLSHRWFKSKKRCK